MPIIKPDSPSTDDNVPNLRPVGMGNIVRRAVTSNVVRDRAADACKLLWPQQIACGVPGGGQILATGIQTHLVEHPTHCAIELDFENAFSTADRRAMLEEIRNADNRVRDLAPLAHATFSPASTIIGLDCPSQFGGQQGDPLVPLAYCLGIQPDLKWADKQLKATPENGRDKADDGHVNAQMDDIFLVGRMEDILLTAKQLAARLKERCNQTLNASKCHIIGRDANAIRKYLAEHPEYDGCIGGLGCVKGLDANVVQWGEGVGIKVNGMPIGDASYVAAKLSKDISKTEANIEKMKSLLQDRSVQALQSFNYYCFQTLFQHHAQSIHPQVLQPYMRKLDAALMKSSHIGTGIDFAKADEITQTRLNLPKRMYGLGIRRQEAVNEAAWIGGMLLTLPRMIDSKDSKGNITPGFMSSLEPLLGAGSFDHGKEETRFEHLVSSESLLGRRFEQTWSKLQNEVSQDQDAAPEQGMLSKPSIAAGWLGTSIVGKGQRRLTREREDARFLRLQQEINELPKTDRRRQAFMNVDRLSTQWVASIPFPGEGIANADYYQIAADHLGVPCVNLARYVGLQIKGDKLDAYGDLLTTAIMTGDGWRLRHDSCKWGLDDWLRYALIPHTTEVFGLFASSLNQAETCTLPASKRQGMVPDFMIQPRPFMPQALNELKIASQSKTYFNERTVGTRCGGVMRRASTINREYEWKCDKADRAYNAFDTSGGAKGPMRLRLAGFGRVRSLVIGPRGEGSEDLHRLLDTIADVAAERKWRRMGARNPHEARAVIAARVYRSIGILSVREAAKMKRERLGIALGDGSAASRRRKRAGQFARTMREEYQAHFVAREQ